MVDWPALESQGLIRKSRAAGLPEVKRESKSMIHV